GVAVSLGTGVYVLLPRVAREEAGPAVVLSFLVAAVASCLAGERAFSHAQSAFHSRVRRGGVCDDPPEQHRGSPAHSARERICAGSQGRPQGLSRGLFDDNFTGMNGAALRRDATETTSDTKDTPARYLGHNAYRICRSEACVRLARHVTLKAELDPCKDMYGYVCKTWVDAQHLQRDVTRRVTVDQAHQDVLAAALHALMVDSTASLPRGFLRIYRRCLEPSSNDSAVLRSKLLDSVGLVPWPLPETNTANPEDVPKLVGNAFYFTNEPVLLRMGVGQDGRVFIAEPTLLRDAPTVNADDVARAARAAFADANRNNPLLDVNKVEELLDSHRRGDDLPPWNTVMPGTDEAVPHAPPKRSNLSRPFWNIRTVLEEAFEPNEALLGVVLRAPSYAAALPKILGKLTAHEIINYLGLRTALLASRLLPTGAKKELLCRVLDWEDLAPAKSVRDHCVRLLAKYEPMLSLHALITKSPLLQELDVDGIINFLKAQLQLLLEAGGLEGPQEHGRMMAATVKDMPWTGLAPSWLRNATLRQRYVRRFYKVGSTSRSAAELFSWIREKAVNDHLALNAPAEFMDVRWKSGLLSTQPHVCTDEGLTGSLELPLAAFDLLWAIDLDTAPLQLARLGVRSFKSVLRHLHQKHCVSPARARSGWDYEKLEVALESRALSLALRAFLAWPKSSELRLQSLEKFSSEQLFFIFYTMHQCEVSSSSMEEALTKRRRRQGGPRPAKASWFNRLVAANEDFAKAFRCRAPRTPPNPFKNCT
ncbi:unnamed protein product, partial [Ixodes hexagonus]